MSYYLSYTYGVGRHLFPRWFSYTRFVKVAP